MSQHWLKPDWEPGLSVPNLPIKYFLDRGVKALILDVDKTLLHGREVDLHSSVSEWVKEAKRDLELHLFSNNPSGKRIGSVAQQLGLSYTFGAAKPRRSALRGVLKRMGIKPIMIAMIGDRIFTDVLVGNRLGLYTVLVKPLGPNGTTSNHDNLQQLEKTIARWIGANKQ